MTTDSLLRTSWRPEHPELPHSETEYLAKKKKSMFSIKISTPWDRGSVWETACLEGWPPEFDLLNAHKGERREQTVL